MINDQIERITLAAKLIEITIANTFTDEDSPFDTKRYLNSVLLLLNNVLAAPTAAEDYFNKRMEDPEYAAAYHVARAKLEK